MRIQIPLGVSALLGFIGECAAGRAVDKGRQCDDGIAGGLGCEGN